MAEAGISMRAFAEPLSVNRIRSLERNGDVLLRRPLMEPSTSSEFSDGAPIVNGTPKINGRGPHTAYAQYSPRFEDSSTDAYPPPPVAWQQTVDEEQGIAENVVIIQPSGGAREGDDTDMEDEVAKSFAKKFSIVPSKSQVLFYLSTSSHLKIHHTGCELQITDSSDFPLLDIWAESVCCGAPIWVVESYGRRVLVMAESGGGGITALLPRGVASLFGRRNRTHTTQSVIDWNGDLIGYFITGDPFLIQNNNRVTIGRCVRTETSSDRDESWECILENGNREVARLERGNLRFASDVSFQLKLLIVAAIARAISQPRPQTACFPMFR